jgi:transposase
VYVHQTIIFLVFSGHGQFGQFLIFLLFFTSNSPKMGKNRDICETDRKLIVQMHKDGKKVAEIAAEKGICVMSVFRILQRYKNEGSYKIKPRSGRPRKLTNRAVRRIVRNSQKQPVLGLMELQQQTDVDASLSTIRNRLAENNIHSYRPTTKPELSEAQIRGRLNWCKEHKSWTADQWEKVIFSDETMMNLPHPRTVKRKPEQKLNKSTTYRTKQGSAGVMIWSCIGMHKLGPCVFTNPYIEPPHRVLTGSSFLKILEDHLPEFIEEQYRTILPVFQQDNAPIHSTKLVTLPN